MSDTPPDDDAVSDDFGIELDDVEERDWREVDPDAPDPDD